MFRIYFISDRTLTPGSDAAAAILGAIEAGVEMVQVREKDLGARALLEIVREVSAAGRRAGAEVFVNSRFDVARAGGAMGVHLPANGLECSQVRSAGGRRVKIGVSTHSIDEAKAAEDGGADFITFGPVFDTPSKRPYGAPVGLKRLHEVLAAVAVPVYALGGIRPENAEAVLALPVSGIAIVSAIAAARDRKQVVDEFRAIGRRARGGEA